MERTALAAAIGFFSMVAGLYALGALSCSNVHGSAISYDHALVLRPGATTFESIPTGLAPDLAPDMFRDENGIVIEASSLDDDHAIVRWNGSTFEPGDYPSPNAESFDEMAEDVAMPSGVHVRRPSYEPRLQLVSPDGSARDVPVPDDYELRTFLPAGGARVLLIPSDAETRTFFVDTATGALIPGPYTPAYMSTLAASDRDGTVVILPGSEVEITRWGRVVMPLVAGTFALAGLVLLTVLVRRQQLPASGAAVGIGLAMTLGVVLVGFLVWALANMTLPL